MHSFPTTQWTIWMVDNERCYAKTVNIFEKESCQHDVQPMVLIANSNGTQLWTGANVNRTLELNLFLSNTQTYLHVCMHDSVCVQIHTHTQNDHRWWWYVEIIQKRYNVIIILHRFLFMLKICWLWCCAPVVKVRHTRLSITWFCLEFD